MDRNKCMMIFNYCNVAASLIMLIGHFLNSNILVILGGVVTVMLCGAYVYDIMLNYKPKDKKPVPKPENNEASGF